MILQYEETTQDQKEGLSGAPENLGGQKRQNLGITFRFMFGTPPLEKHAPQHTVADD